MTHALIMVALMAGLPISLWAQEKPVTKVRAKTSTQPAKKTKQTAQAKPVNELAKLRDEYVKATNEYKTNLEKLRASYEKDVSRMETELAKTQELFAAGLVSKKQVEANELLVAQARDKVADANQKLKNADTQIADTLLEAEAESKIAKSRPLPRGALVSTTALIRYNGGAAWALSDAWKVQRFFQDSFKKPLPIAVFGQGGIHDRWRLDHHNSMDISLHPDGAEGQALLGFLRANGIPFLAFRQAIPGTATGPHIHVGRPSHRY